MRELADLWNALTGFVARCREKFRSFMDWLAGACAAAPKWCMAWSAIAATCTGLALWFTSQASHVVLAFGAGTGFVVALLMFNHGLRFALLDQAGRAKAIGAGATTVGVAIAGFGIYRTSILATAIGIAAIGVGVMAFAVASQESSNSGWASRHRAGLIIAGLAASATAVVINLFADAHVPIVVAVIVGLLIYKIGLREPDARYDAGATKTPPRGAHLAASLSALAGLILLLIGSRHSPRLSIVGAYLLAVGFMGLSVTWPHRGFWPIDRQLARFLGVAVLALTALVIISVGVGAGAAITTVVALGGIGAAIVWKYEGMVIGLVLALVVLWTMVDSTNNELTTPVENAENVIVSFGDSYMSGEGTNDYFPATNQVGNERNECRRTPQAYAYQVAEELGYGLEFFACSAAVVDDLIGSERDIADGIPQCPAAPGKPAAEGQMPDSPEEIYGKYAQICNLPEDRSNIRVALVSIGGNDSGFSDVAIGCLLPGTCDDLRDVWLGGVELIGDRLVQAYTEIKQALPDVPVVVMPYPHMITAEGCGWSQFDSDEHIFVSQFVTVLNQQIRTSAARAGVNFFEDAVFAFHGKRICDGDGPDDTVMNFITLRPTEGDFLARLNPGKWVHGSMHPKASGHDETTKALLAWLPGFLADVDSGIVEPNPEPQDISALKVAGINALNPILVDPEGLELHADDDLCTETNTNSFGTQLRVFDGPMDTTIDVPLVDAAVGLPVCLQGRTGAWTTEELMLGTGDSRGVTVVRPTDGRVSQTILFQDSEMVWQSRVVTFCSLDPSCDADFSRWTRQQLVRSLQLTAPLIVLLLVAGWLVAIGGSEDGFLRQWGKKTKRQIAAMKRGESSQASESPAAASADT